MTNIKGAYIAKSGSFQNYIVRITTASNVGGFVLVNTNKGIKWGTFSVYECISDTLSISFDGTNGYFTVQSKEGRTGHIAYNAIVIAFNTIYNITGVDN